MRKIILLLLLSVFNFSFSQKETSPNQLKKLEKEISILKIKSDSLTNKLYNIEKNDYKSLDVIDKIDMFYERSWNKLIIFLSIASTIILFILPYLFSKYQEQKINFKSQELEEFVNKKIESAENKILEFHKSEFELLKNEIELAQNDLGKNIDDQKQFIEGYILAVRGMIFEIDNNYDSFFSYYITAIEQFLKINKLTEAENAIMGLNKRIQKCIDKKHKLNDKTKFDLQNLILNLDRNFSHLYADKTTWLKNNLKNLS